MEDILQEVKRALVRLDQQHSALERRKCSAQLAHLLHEVSPTVVDKLLEVMERRQTAETLLNQLHSALRPGDAAIMQEQVDLVRTTLSCLASYAYLGGVIHLQRSGAFPPLIALMASGDPTARTYAGAAMVNASAFIEALDLNTLSRLEVQLEALARQPDLSISGPASTVLSNLHRARAIQSGRFAVFEPESSGASSTASGAYDHLTAAPGSNWWDYCQQEGQTFKPDPKLEEVLDWDAIHGMVEELDELVLRVVDPEGALQVGAVQQEGNTVLEPDDRRGVSEDGVGTSEDGVSVSEDGLREGVSMCNGLGVGEGVGEDETGGSGDMANEMGAEMSTWGSRKNSALSKSVVVGQHPMSEDPVVGISTSLLVPSVAESAFVTHPPPSGVGSLNMSRRVPAPLVRGRCCTHAGVAAQRRYEDRWVPEWNSLSEQVQS